MIAVSLWWVYFDNLDGSAIHAAQQEGETVLYQEWLYLHLPLVVGLTATGVGVEHVLTSELRAPLPAGERWLLCGALALCLFTLSALHHTTDTYTDRSTRIQSLYRSGAGAVVMLVAIVGTGLTPITIVGFLAVICVIQIVLDLREREPRTEVVPSD